MRSISIFIVSFVFSAVAFGQERCGFDHKHSVEPADQFEKWLRQARKVSAARVSMDEILTIPVVFHVIHNGEAVGEGGNISDDRILDQLRILNEDFSRSHADTVLTPLEFRPVAADIGIQFEMAQQDPERLPTAGITRSRGNQSSYTISEDRTLKSVIQWPPEDYLNIYVADLNGFFGWAQFPFTDIEGITDIETDGSTDGVVVDFHFVGVNLETGGSFESFGRTLTHEVGHFLGLRHVWGDGGCTVDDFCDDTPQSSVRYSGSCPSEEQTSCGSSDMYSNFLYLTDDACMNIFTQCQKERMRTVLLNSPRRSGLPNSQGLNAAITVENDLGIREIRMPSSGECDGSVIPQIVVRNYGTNSITSFTLSLQNSDESISEQIDINTDLNPLDRLGVNFSSITLSTTQELQFSITEVNNTSDGNTLNNISSITVASTVSASIPFEENFETSNSGSFISQEDLIAIRQAPLQAVENQALTFEFFQETSGFGLKHTFVLPDIERGSFNSGQINFDYAYANDSLQSLDGLALAYSLDCGATFPESQYLFRAFGDDLKSSSREIGGTFIPSGPSEWQSVSVNVTEFLSDPDLRFAFIGINGSGNNIYVDNIILEPTDLNAFDMSINNISNFPVVTCDDDFVFSVDLTNEGFERINSFDINYSVNGSTNIATFDTNLSSGQSDDFIVSIEGLTQGSNNLEFTLGNLNGQADQDASNNALNRVITLNNQLDSLPFRQNFEDLNNWVLASETGNNDFEFDENNGWIKGRGFENSSIGNTSWLVSPIFDTENLQNGSLIFDVAYAYNGIGTERLQVLLSISCGERFEETLLDLSGSQLSTSTATGNFQPQSPEDWQRVTVDISRSVSFSDVRLAFLFTNGSGENLYLDNIEVAPTAAESLFIFDDVLRVYPNPAEQQFSATINLPDKQSAVISLMDIQGKVVTRFLEADALNQTFDFEVALPGIYFLQIRSSSVTTARRIIVR